MFRAWTPSQAHRGALPARWRDSHGRRQMPCLMAFAEEELKRSNGGRVLDIGCGAGRNALPLARLGWNVVGTDLSWPMLCAAAGSTHEQGLDDRFMWSLRRWSVSR